MERISVEDLCVDFLNRPENRTFIANHLYSFYDAYESNKKYDDFVPVLTPHAVLDQNGNLNLNLKMSQASCDSLSIEGHMIFSMNLLAKHFLH